MSEKTDVNEQVNTLLGKNKISDLERFLEKRKNLNETNSKLIYIYHALQSSGIFVTTFATGYKLEYLIWVGIGLNCIASLINIYEQINNTMLNKLLSNIKLIKDNKYIDEDILVNVDNSSQKKNELDKII